MIVIIVSIAFAIAYIIYIYKASKGWDTYKKRIAKGDLKNQPISILVPFRDEETRIEDQISSLLPLLHSKDDEIIYLNDHSTDKGKSILEKHIRANTKVQIIDLGKDKTGKKEALELGIANAKNEWIITTDADCTYGANWLSQWKETIAMSSSNMLVGPVKIEEENSILSKYQALEFAGLMSLGAGSLANGKAHTCSGANLAFKKSVLMEVNGYEGNKQFASGDDEFLMHKFYAKDPESVQFAYNSHLLVRAQAAGTWKEFFSQRIRWASKGKGYQNKNLRYEQVFVAVYLLLFWFSFGLALAQFPYAEIACTLLFLAKLGMDYFLLSKTAYFFKVDSILTYLPMAQLIQYIYVPIVAIASLFVKGSWKGREI